MSQMDLTAFFVWQLQTSNWIAVARGTRLIQSCPSKKKRGSCN